MNTPTRILIAARQGDGLTHIGCVDDVEARVQLLQAYGVEIAATFASERSKHALEVTQALKRRFTLAALEPGGPWFAVEYGRVLDALREYDMASGLRLRRGPVTVGASVHVAGIGWGTVRGFTACGRARVSIEHCAHAAREVLAPPSLVESFA